MLLALVLSLLIGVALGLFGGGGSMLAVPTLVYVLGFSARTAVGSSLLIVGATSVVALVPHVRAGRVDARTGVVFGAGAMLGAYAGAALTHFIPDAVLLVGFGVMMLVTALAMLRGGNQAATEGAAAERRGPASKLVLYGAGVGLSSGIFGAGGGFLIVPALTLLGGLPMRRAIATSLLVISLQSISGFLGHLGRSNIPIRAIAPLTVLAALGSVLGSSLVKRLRPVALRRGFASLVLAVGLFVVVQQASRLSHAPPAPVGRLVTR